MATRHTHRIVGSALRNAMRQTVEHYLPRDAPRPRIAARVRMESEDWDIYVAWNDEETTRFTFPEAEVQEAWRRVSRADPGTGGVVHLMFGREVGDIARRLYPRPDARGLQNETPRFHSAAPPEPKNFKD